MDEIVLDLKALTKLAPEVGLELSAPLSSQNLILLPCKNLRRCAGPSFYDKGFHKETLLRQKSRKTNLKLIHYNMLHVLTQFLTHPVIPGKPRKDWLRPGNIGKFNGTRTGFKPSVENGTNGGDLRTLTSAFDCALASGIMPA